MVILILLGLSLLVGWLVSRAPCISLRLVGGKGGIIPVVLLPFRWGQSVIVWILYDLPTVV